LLGVYNGTAYDFTSKDSDLDKIRRRIAGMPDGILEKYGRAAASMAERSNRETYRIQRDEARAEWKRRHLTPLTP